MFTILNPMTVTTHIVMKTLAKRTTATKARNDKLMTFFWNWDTIFVEEEEEESSNFISFEMLPNSSKDSDDVDDDVDDLSKAWNERRARRRGNGGENSPRESWSSEWERARERERKGLLCANDDTNDREEESAGVRGSMHQREREREMIIYKDCRHQQDSSIKWVWCEKSPSHTTLDCGANPINHFPSCLVIFMLILINLQLQLTKISLNWLVLFSLKTMSSSWDLVGFEFTAFWSCARSIRASADMIIMLFTSGSKLKSNANSSTKQATQKYPSINIYNK